MTAARRQLEVAGDDETVVEVITAELTGRVLAGNDPVHCATLMPRPVAGSRRRVRKAAGGAMASCSGLAMPRRRRHPIDPARPRYRWSRKAVAATRSCCQP